MKKKFCFSLAVILTATILLVNAQQNARITHSGIGYLEYLPEGYHSNSDKYPVVISLHGVREKGTSSTDPQRVMKDLPRVAYISLPKYVKQGKKYPFILISPQLKNNYGSWPPSYIMDVLNHVKKSLRIDDKRIYLTGLSLGGMGVWKTAAAYPEVFAAIAPICPGGNALDKAGAIAAENVAAWGFHGTSDGVVSYTVTTKMIEAMNSAPKKPNPPAKVTLFSGMGHVIWDKAYLETNVLDWMLGFRNGASGSSASPPANKPPVVNAGPDKTLRLPTNSIYIEGTASDPDGTIVSHHWTKISGGNAGMAQTNEPRLKAYDLEEGTYVFRLTVKDNDGASASGEVKVTVEPSANKLPVANAGADKSLALPANSINLHGSAEDSDGQIVSYHWTKVTGGYAGMSGVSSPQLAISQLTEGTYLFRLTVKDNDGASASDEVKVSVRSPDNKPPVVSAGSDKIVTIPTSAIHLEGRAEDPDGDVVSYEWTKVSGGAAQLDGTNTAQLIVSNPEAGDYLFRLSAVDDHGARDSDDVKVTVKEIPSEDISAGENLTPEEPEKPEFTLKDIPAPDTKSRLPQLPIPFWSGEISQNFQPVTQEIRPVLNGYKVPTQAQE